ncbi:MAG: LysR family transcriptional regulator [Cypionkella sp.]|uniref:LysR family transcriptional regulator n=1 Tax=Cypionkella sp. TaxID=2811411 RepID=UPI002AB8AA9B|nr:LysR family transcriptional regulator [Cypionkella sp.]MDZ4309340.1 LysR family transcriptional regulator [Cypionkella sp.]MDZ4395292.1 LysR family transcriptional regulator [Cypionkella sp.]
MDRLISERMFVTVLETGSFAAAAQRLGTSSGQASKLVSRLEAELGVRLLHRTTRALAATEAGQAYFDRLRSLLEEFDALDTQTRNAALLPRGKIRLSAPLSFGTIRLAPCLADFAKAYPEIALDVHFSDRLVNLVDEGFDMAVRVGKPRDTTLIARKLCSSQLIVAAAPGYLAARGAPKTPQDLSQHDCLIDTNYRDPHRWMFSQNQRIAVDGRLTFSNASACVIAAEAGLGIASSPDFVMAESLASGRLIRLLQEYEEPPMGVFALYPSGRHLALKMRVLIDYLAQNLPHPIPSI